MQLKPLWKRVATRHNTQALGSNHRCIFEHRIDGQLRMPVRLVCARRAVADVVRDVAIGPLVVDLLAYVTAGQLIVSSVTARRSGSKSVGTTASITLWLDANASTVVLAMAVGVDARFVGWTLDGYYSAGSPRTHAMQFGPGHWS